MLTLDLVKGLTAEAAAYAMWVGGPTQPLTDSGHSALQDLYRNGFAVIKHYYSASQVQELRDEVIRVINNRSGVWLDALGSDHRYFGAEGNSESIRRHLADERIASIGKTYTRSHLLAHLSLAAQMIYKPGNVGSGGGWHRDSPIRRQFKSILYLKEVNKDNGPFQYFAGSHRRDSVLRLLSSGLQKFRQYRFTDTEIEKIESESSLAPVTFTGNAGDLILVDTRGIHRGAPMTNGERISLTNYFWEKTIPLHFQNDMKRYGA